MNANEVVGALRSCSNHHTRKPDCDNCPLFGERLCVKKMLEGGADLIESLQSQLAAEKRREKAAVDDINSVRMCHTCKHFLREFGMGGIECKIPCATIRHENFEWRGPQAGEESR